VEWFATKTNVEREDEETERLVRESPKVKPPRQDKRRERVEPDEDPDLEHEKKDLSKNFKDVGGSVRELVRIALARKLITVRLKKDPSKIVQVTRETFKSSPGEYEEIKEEEKPKKIKKLSPKGKKPPLKKKKEVEEKPPKERPESEEKPEEKPKPEEEKLEVKKPPKEKPVKERRKKIIPETEPGEIPETKPGEIPETKPGEERELKKEPEKKEKKPKKELAPGAPKRPVTNDEVNNSRDLLRSTFPTETAVSLMLVRPELHPDEINELVADYHVAKSLPIDAEDVNKLRNQLKSFTLNPNEVPPPRFVEGKKGERISFGKLPKEKKAEAYRQHQIRSVAMNIAARDAAAKTFEKEIKAPKDLSEALASFTLSGYNESPLDRQRRAAKKADELFYKGLEAEPPKKLISPETIEKVFNAVKRDPLSKKLAVGYFQSHDYQAARKQFLDPKSKDHISERKSPKAIALGIRKAMEFLRKQSDQYPEGMAVQDTAMLFRNRVMRHLHTLVPDKTDEVQEALDKEDVRYYDEALKKYEKALGKYERKQKRAKEDAKRALREHSKKVKKGEQGKPPLSAEERLAKKGVFEPKKPAKPPLYDVYGKSPDELKASAEQFWESFGKRTAVVSRYLSNTISIYSNTSAMGTNRQAVYWGVKPEKVRPYPEWSQPANLREEDFARLLRSAKEWLKTPVLSTNIDGVIKDTQLRAALDLAIRAEGFDYLIHPQIYNSLLARLAGRSQDETLLTIKTARREMSKKVELDVSAADRILARLDRMASTVQKDHEKWGMSFEVAKELVNEIDRVADDLEVNTYGERSLVTRQAQVLEGMDKTAEVIQREGDEPYMDTFKNPHQPRQTEADEPYMAAYANDDSSDVRHGKSTTGRPLAP
jgi:hypothetical protein